MNILVFGNRNGQLCNQIISTYQDHYNKSNVNFIFIGHEQLDLSINDYKYIENTISDILDNQYNLSLIDIDLIINTIAYTKVDIIDENEYELCKNINIFAVRNISKLCIKYDNIKMIHISTDYVFGKDTTVVPYKETDVPNPINHYGYTKLHGEIIARRIMPREDIIILRTSWLYDNVKGHQNFLNKIVNKIEGRFFNDEDIVSVVDNQFGSPTSVLTLVDVIYTIIDNLYEHNIFHYGLYHICDKTHNGVSRYKFAKEIAKLYIEKLLVNNTNIKLDLNNIVKPIIIKDQISNNKWSKRPGFSVLDPSKFEKIYNYKLPYWKDSLKITMETQY